MTGQEVMIRIIQAQYLPPPHRRSRYKYEVVDKASPYDGKIDWAESDQELKRGHSYVVRMNSIQENPRIEEMIEEVVEDLTPYVEALKAIGRPASAREVATELENSHGMSVGWDAARRRLDRLVDDDPRFKRTRSLSAGRPYLYEAVGLET